MAGSSLWMLVRPEPPGIGPSGRVTARPPPRPPSCGGGDSEESEESEEFPPNRGDTHRRLDHPHLRVLAIMPQPLRLLRDFRDLKAYRDSPAPVRDRSRAPRHRVCAASPVGAARGPATSASAAARRWRRTTPHTPGA